MNKVLRNGLMSAMGGVSLVPAQPALGQGAWLSAQEIEQALAGRTIHGVYATGRHFMERYLKGGDLEYTENGITLRGRWSIAAGALCTIYDTDPTGGCFRVAPSGRNCFEFYFVARSEEQAREPADARPHWTARGAVEGKAEACEDGASV